MSELRTRTLTGGIFGAVVILAIIVSFWSFLALFTLVNAVCLYEYLQITLTSHKHNKSKWITILGGSLLFLSPFLYQFFNLSQSLLLLAIVVCLIIILIHILLEWLPNVHQSLHLIGGIMIISMPLSAVFYLSGYNEAYNCNVILFIIGLIWTSDMGQYFLGRKLGKHLLAVAISPKKTWEGLLGGLIVTVILSVCICSYFQLYNLKHSIVIAVLIVVFGTLGDLTQSSLKRHYSVKDSGNILPGHGGLYDRFDAVLFAFPIVAFYLDCVK